MAIEETVYATLSGASAVTTLATGGVYFAPVAESVALPYVELQYISGTTLPTLPGVGDSEREIIRVGCCANTHASARAIADAVLTALEGDGYFDGRFSFYDPETQVHTVSVDWTYIT